MRRLLKRTWKYPTVAGAVALVAILVLALMPAGVTINQNGFLSLDSNVVFAAAVRITNSPSEKPFGTLAVNTYSSTAINYFTITNKGNTAVDIAVYATDLTGGEVTWTLSNTATPGENIYGLKAGLDDGDDNFDIVVRKSEVYNELVNNLARGATQDWGLMLYMPTSVTDYDGQQMLSTLTLICSIH